MKARLLHTVLFLLAWTGLSCQEGRIREPVVAGQFYSGDAEVLEAQLKMLFEAAGDPGPDARVAALIVPHAGYVFSGEVAAAAYAKLDPEISFKRIFIIGSSHHVAVDGASVYGGGAYATPLGKVPVDREVAEKLIRENRKIASVPEAHSREHSIEVQLPFLQYRLQEPFQIVPIMVGPHSDKFPGELAAILRPWFTPENLFVISSDFSHYPSYDDGTRADQATGKAIMSMEPERFLEILRENERTGTPGLLTSCCGWTSVLTLLELCAAQEDLEVQHLRYMNSGDSPYGDRGRVVGYHAFAFTRKAGDKDFVLLPGEKEELLRIARSSIEAQLEGRGDGPAELKEASPALLAHCGAFVTLNMGRRLRGCIGCFLPDKPLWQVVEEMAAAAAFRDTRFPPVEAGEMTDIEIEISVLTPLKRIEDIGEFELGRHGIYMVKGRQHGTFLPQVAESTGWSKEEFLGHCARDKAGIGWNGWKDAELYTYEALVFHEHENQEGKQ